LLGEDALTYIKNEAFSCRLFQAVSAAGILLAGLGMLAALLGCQPA
jgi:hypothetical protein